MSESVSHQPPLFIDEEKEALAELVELFAV